ncbi:ribosome biogenesis protein Kri1 [Histoplasma capsulatum var. duboisii H88]|uniref:Ribosome biogenesis protein Kri1 n=1 Tax=Ajellomyces capsulatus (strain H88) TaxID=544711 RepID=F0U9H0_AJEC8|nr:ribosome biogenesis protein Kri1 [Histoplasma capsulatum var. duboisii H88]QSS52501.1 ribosome biogenesis protein Kri1 [Histoplasma capsulatum var. duboisii H88]
MEPPAKKQKKLLMDDDSSNDSSDDGGALLGNGNNNIGFKVNEEYAKRFEYNKKREEIQQLEDKYGKTTGLGKRKKLADDGADTSDGSEEDEGESSSESEDEDDEGVLATEDLDREIFDTLNAIRSKDPRVYDANVKFYSEIKETEDELESSSAKKEKPMFIRDYHRENLLRGGANGSEKEAEEEPKTFAQEQADLKREIIKEMHATNDASDGGSEGEDEEGGFLIPKTKPTVPDITKAPVLDVESADKDPETFLSNFLKSRAWVPTEKSKFQPLESDDEEEEQQAEAFEEAYNFRFEDPNKINEVLVTHSRDTTSKLSVRREDQSSRKKKRLTERLKKEEEKKQREAERNRLRKLKIEQLEEKIEKIKAAAGLRTSDFSEEDWARFLDDGWDDAKWEEEMEKRFGEKYYAEAENGDDTSSGGGLHGGSKKRKMKKPKWDDDIDIKDLVPDFDDEEGEMAQLSDMDMQDAAHEGGDEGINGDGDEEDAAKPKSYKHKKKQALQEKKEKQKEARKERRKIEQLVDKSLDLDLDTALLPGASKKYSGQFRYRETSPVSFGLTARDILIADDSALNQFAGLKKLASFRDPERKKKDFKKLGKKARLRQWRKETFGDENGTPADFALPLTAQESTSAGAEGKHATDKNKDDGAMTVRLEYPKKKRKRSKKKKHQEGLAEA